MTATAASTSADMIWAADTPFRITIETASEQEQKEFVIEALRFIWVVMHSCLDTSGFHFAVDVCAVLWICFLSALACF